MPAAVNPQVTDALAVTAKATLSPEVIVREGAGKAYQSVAQSMAIAVQDSVDGLRNFNTMATTAAGVALAQLLATKDPFYTTVLKTTEDAMKAAAANMLTIGQNAATVLKNFPSS